jgi:hypothetical protein
MPEEDFHLSSQVHFQAHMPSLRDFSVFRFTDPQFHAGLSTGRPFGTRETAVLPGWAILVMV